VADSPRLMLGDCLERMKEIPDGSINLIATDPPYMNVKRSESWDRQWKTPAEFLTWMGRLCEEWRRVLAPNGSLYVFAYPGMAAGVECKIGEHFQVLNSIVWQKEKDRGKHALNCKESQRSYFPNTERIIFAEHFGADSMALGESGYAAKCEALRGFVFEPIRAYLDGERKRAGIPHRTVIAALGMGGHDSHFFSPIQWKLPLPDQYQVMRDLFNSGDGDYLRREYEDLRREYEDLRREYEDLRRPFTVSSQVPYTDVWDFATVPHRPGKHVCEKPYDLLAHVIAASSRPGDLVLDSFMGSGVTGEAAITLGRRFIGIEQDPKWFDRASRRIEKASNPAKPITPEPTLFSMTG
jgi:adenine-specific DNA-methyltransferase